MFTAIRIIIARLAPYALQYGGQFITLLSGLSLKQIAYIMALVALLSSYVYVYDLGGDNRQNEIERKATRDATEKAKKKQIINNSALDVNDAINRMLNFKSKL